MGKRRKSSPSYLFHKQTGRGRAVWTDQTGQRHDQLLPGQYESKESRKAFHDLALAVETSPLQQPKPDEDIEAPSSTVADVLLAYRLHADQHYRGADGKPTSEIYEVKIVIKAIRELYEDTPVVEFGPLCVKAARQQWVKEGRSRTECNRRVGVVKRIFKWAVSEQLVPVTVYQAVATVAGLQRGRTEAPEVPPVGPVDDAVVDATLPCLSRHVRGLIEFQRLTGCRPGEACTVRRSEIDTGGPVWIYRPTNHKNSWRGKSRAIAIGPKAQTLIREFFTPNLDDYLFSPIRAMEELEVKPKKRAKWAPKDRYDRTSYTRAIARACEYAFPLPAPLAQIEDETRAEWWERLAVRQKAEVKAWRESHRWHPNQLRHTHATKVRKTFSLEHAGAALGHTKMSASEIYAERDAGLAVEVATKLG